MLNYIKAELYRTFNRKYFYVFTGILAALVLSLNILVKTIGAKDNMTIIKALGIPVMNYMLLLPVALLVIIIDMIYAEEYKNGTLKNIVSFGMSRSKFIFGKFITIIILAFISDFCVLFIFWGSSAAFFGVGKLPNGVEFTTYVNVVVTRYCAAVILWIAVIAVGLLLSTFVNSYNAFIYSYIGIFVVLPMTINILSHMIDKNIAKVNNFLLTAHISSVATYNGTNQGDVFKSVAVGLAYIVVCLGLSLVWFSKKDVK